MDGKNKVKREIEKINIPKTEKNVLSKKSESKKILNNIKELQEKIKKLEEILFG